MLETTERNSLDVINFTNIDNSDFEGMWDGEITVIRVGETRPFPRFLAYHYTKHLIDKILLKGGGDYGDELMRKPLEEKILGIVSITPETVEPTIPEPVSSGTVGQVVTPGEEKGEEGFVEVPIETPVMVEPIKKPETKKRGKK